MTEKFSPKTDVTPKPDGKKSGSKFFFRFDCVLNKYIFFGCLVADLPRNAVKMVEVIHNIPQAMQKAIRRL
ncbi:hypothetical protein ACTM9V_03400 [Oliverpabstia intestinalis]|uniref:hypothetical protein n=1 Tax=Oliverpabstia intestinalis TaxID=2606633 RepID=UPI003F889C82